MDSLPPEPTQSWFAIKAAVALSPVLTLLIADLIDWFLRHTLWRRSEVAPQAAGEPERQEPAAVAAPPG